MLTDFKIVSDERLIIKAVQGAGFDFARRPEAEGQRRSVMIRTYPKLSVRIGCGGERVWG
ncbi:hypothetical protein ACX27_27985 [Nostoc piscinale CENA21]|uniref:Uncharacterized protein n=1 Tax=Nostoc piscinale CENA21 TaxID=224013 RepID=A0A0M3V6Q0_9NOSO|nr:hypothetical protein ACX27_27985 [Nostoc piscinale CENA21]